MAKAWGLTDKAFFIPAKKEQILDNDQDKIVTKEVERARVKKEKSR